MDVPEGEDFTVHLNPSSLEVLEEARLEPALAGPEVGSRVQFERHGYFCADPDSTSDTAVWNRAVTLRDTWAKVKGKGK